MKKNMLAVVILAATLINLTLTAVSLFVVVPNAKQTNALITKVLQVIDLELESPIPMANNSIDITDLETYLLNENNEIYVTLTNETNETKTHMASVKCSLSINKKSEDYSTLQPLIAEQEDRIIEIVSKVIEGYKKSNLLENKELIKETILTEVQALFGSDFIVNVTFSQFLAQ